ncbi:MAG TPA: prolyl oligopeptidase family serine peptidase [Candidatus Janibacter merdipullorum]|nr:prolyl oligopeptidase family serine peptidase [Candidatus Janibacter merdipullorum]
MRLGLGDVAGVEVVTGDIAVPPRQVVVAVEDADGIAARRHPHSQPSGPDVLSPHVRPRQSDSLPCGVPAHCRPTSPAETVSGTRHQRHRGRWCGPRRQTNAHTACGSRIAPSSPGRSSERPWSELADEHGFAVVYPQQTSGNNANSCFTFVERGDTTRGQGEVQSIASMVQHARSTHGLGTDNTFITGLSAGGGMTSAMLATYPGLFAGGVGRRWPAVSLCDVDGRCLRLHELTAGQDAAAVGRPRPRRVPRIHGRTAEGRRLARHLRHDRRPGQCHRARRPVHRRRRCGPDPDRDDRAPRRDDPHELRRRGRRPLLRHGHGPRHPGRPGQRRRAVWPGGRVLPRHDLLGKARRRLLRGQRPGGGAR